jgi:DtxR family Mn-dependent transcriptional regulator
MGSESVEEYLEAIYYFNEKGELAKNVELAEKLGVAPSSVTQMIKKLAAEGFIEYQPYKGVTLTGKGMALAQKVVRKHRLLERFLHDFLGFEVHKIHNEACRLEHSLSDAAAAALCKALNKPSKSPSDDNPIPPCTLDVDDCEQCVSVVEEEGLKLVTELSNLKPGEEGEVAFIRGGQKACQRLIDMGLTRGIRVKTVNAAPFHGPIEVEVRGTTLALGRGLATHVFIEIHNHSPAQEVKHPHGPYHGRDRR